MMQRREVFIRTLSVGHTRGDSWADQAACQGDDPTEWDDTGTGHAFYICTERCPVRTECAEAALLEGPKGQMRAGIWFDDKGILRNPRHLRRVS